MKPEYRPYLIRLIVIVLISFVAMLVIMEGAYLLQKDDTDRAPKTVQIVIPPGERLGDVVIDVEGLKKGYGDRLLVEDMEFKLPPGGIVGIIGPNGAGKTSPPLIVRLLI